MFERKAVIPTEYKAARFLQRKEVFSFFLSCFSFSNTIEPKGHFIDHSEVMSPVMSLVIYLNVISPSPPLSQSKSGLLLQKVDRNEAEPSCLLYSFISSFVPFLYISLPSVSSSL